MKSFIKIGAWGFVLGLASSANAQTVRVVPPAPPAPPAPPSYQVMPVPAPAAVPLAPPRHFTAAEHDVGVDIARMLNTREDTARAVDGQFLTAMRAEMAKDDAYVQLEARYPGISEAVLAATARELHRLIDTRLPSLWDRLGTAYAETFDAAELARLKGLYSGPAGQALIKGLYERTDFGKMAAKGYEHPDAAISADDIREVLGPGAGAAAVAGLPPEMRRELMDISVSPIGLKLHRLGPRLTQIAADWGNELQKQEQQQVRDVVLQAAIDYMAKADAARRAPGPRK